MKAIIKRIMLISVFVCVSILMDALSVNVALAQDENSLYALSYHVGAYNIFTESNGELSVTIDGTKYYYSDDFDAGDIGTKLPEMENKNVVYELHDNRIVKTYTMDEVMFSEAKAEAGVKEGLIYRNGKFSQESFDLVVKISNHLRSNFQENDLLWFLSETEKERLYITLKGLEIQPLGGVNFGSSGWWLWKEYQTTISENLNDTIKIGETKEYRYTVNLQNDKVINQNEYSIEIYTTPTFDTGTGERVKGRVKVGNLDYQEKIAEEKKETSVSGRTTTVASTQLQNADGLHLAGTMWNNYFDTVQKKKIEEFVYGWVAELIAAEVTDYTEFNKWAEKEIKEKVCSKLGIDPKVITTSSSIDASANLLTITKDGTQVILNFTSNISSFKFGANAEKPMGAFGTVEMEIYRVSDGNQLGATESSIISYSDIGTFIENLQAVAQSTIYDIGKKAYGLSADKAADAFVTGIIKVLNSDSRCFSIVSKLSSKQKIVIKKIAQKLTSKGIKKCNDKIFELITTPSNNYSVHSIDCPVDVKVYDNDGNLCGAVINNQVDAQYQDVFITVVGDRKNIYLSGDDYSFELIGTDTGTMDYTVKEYDGNGNEMRIITYEGVPLTEGCEYYALAPEAANVNSILYDLTDSEGGIISPTTGADEDISVIASGTCGDNVFWKLSDDNVLRIWGNGAMYDFYPSGSNVPPWYSYENRNQIREIIIEDGITSIGDNAFVECRKLATIKIPNGVERIGGYTFCNCTSLETVIVPGTIKIMGYDVFANCPKLETAGPVNGNYNIQFDWTTEIPDNAFRECSGLKRVLIPESIETMGTNIFYGCDGLKTAGLIGSDSNIEFGWKREIPDNAFSGCSSLEAVVIPETVFRIGSGAFSGTGLKNLELCKNILEIGSYAFYNCRNLENIYYDVVCLESDREAEYTYTKSVFSNVGIDTSGVSVTIGNDVTDIPDYIFYGGYNTCNIKDLKIGKNVEYIGIWAFAYCRTIEKIYYNAKHVISYDSDDSVSYGIGGPFYNCSSEQGLELIIGDDVEYIPNRIFSTQRDLYDRNLYTDFACRKISIGKNVREINHALIRFKELESFEVSDLNNYYLSEDGILFSKDKRAILCYPAAKVDISFGLPENVLTVEEDAFIYCANLKEIKLNSSLQVIKAGAFWNCSNLETLLISGNVRSIGQRVFSGCDKLQTAGPMGGDYNIQIGQMLEIPGNAFSSCDKLNSVIIPEGVEIIGESAFQRCKSLVSVEIQEGVEIIGESAFRECESLVSVEIQQGLKTIGKDAFGFCTKLTSILIPKSVESVGNEAFYQTPWLLKKKEAGEVVIAGAVLYDATAYIGYNYIIPEYITSIRECAFYECNNIRSIIIPDSVTSIGDRAFYECDLRTITIPSSVTRIGRAVFYGNWDLREIYMCGDAPTDTNEDAFVNSCGDIYILPNAEGYDTEPWINYNIIVKKDIENSEIKPDSGQKPQDSAKPSMSDQPVTNSVTVGVTLKDDEKEAVYTVTAVDSKGGGTVLYKKLVSQKTTKAVIPAMVKFDGVIYKVTGIGANAFSDCTKLKAVSIGRNVTSIGAKAFYRCKSLTKVIIPAKVSRIGRQAFYGCKKLKSITIKTKKLTAKSVGSKAFKGIYAKTSIKAPKGKLKSYRKILKARGVGAKAKIK